jgi:hypothetical protein
VRIRDDCRLWKGLLGEETQQKSSAPVGTITTRVEQKQVEERLAIGAHVVYETIRRKGEDVKAKRNCIARRQHWDGPHWRRDSRRDFLLSRKAC